MVEELEFKNAYKQAYDAIRPDKECVSRVVDRKRRRNVWRMMLQPVAPVVRVLFLSAVLLLPVMAKEIPSVYNVVSKFAPGLASFILQEEVKCTSNGITMQVEAVNVEGDHAEILVSFADAAGSGENLIKGTIDLFDSYCVQSYGAVNNISGCSFLEYDAAEDKAYFKIEVTSFEEFKSSKLTFQVHQILTNSSNERKDISLDELITNPDTKQVDFNGFSGAGMYESSENYLFHQVLDVKKADDSMADELTITAVAYKDGLLRVQSCRGTFDDADRHLQPFVAFYGGKTVHELFSVMWQEEIEGETFLFDEHCFSVDEDELENIHLYGIFHVTDGSVKGDWEVTVSLE